MSSGSLVSTRRISLFTKSSNSQPASASTSRARRYFCSRSRGVTALLSVVAVVEGPLEAISRSSEGECRQGRGHNFALGSQLDSLNSEDPQRRGMETRETALSRLKHGFKS